MFERAEIDCPRLEEIGNRFGRTSEFHSVAFLPKAPSPTYPKFDRGFQAVLMDVLQSDFLGKEVPELLPIDFSAAMEFSTLDRYEFEGSLISALLAGTCTERVVGDEQEAREAVQSILGRLFRPEGSLWAWRLDDQSWSAFSKSATTTWAYVAYESSQRIWWFVCFADHY